MDGNNIFRLMRFRFLSLTPCSNYFLLKRIIPTNKKDVR